MKGIITISILTLSLMVGCREKKQSTDDFITVDVTASYPKKELILQDFLDVEYIMLETNDKFITSASPQAVDRDVLLMKDLNRVDYGNIFIFSRNGKGLEKINRLGQGGEEYTNVLGVVLDDKNGEIFVNSHLSKKVLVYDLLGTFKRSFKHKDGVFYNRIGDFDQNYLICHDGYFEINEPESKKNYFLLISKKDGSIKEIQIPYSEQKLPMLMERNANGEAIYCIYNEPQIPNHGDWILVEPSSDTIYTYSRDQILKPFIVRTPSVQLMNPEVFLFPGVITDRYYFMQTVKKEFDFAKVTGFPSVDLIYDRQANAIFECVVYNSDYTDKKSMSLVYQIPIPPVIVNNGEIAFMTRLEAPELVEAYEAGKLKGQLKEIAALLNEDSNPVIMLAKYKK